MCPIGPERPRIEAEASAGLRAYPDAVGRLVEAIEIMDQKITPYGEREDGTTLNYIVADSTWHRVLAAAREWVHIDAMKSDVDEYCESPCADCDRPRRLHSEAPASPMHDWHPFREVER